MTEELIKINYEKLKTQCKDNINLQDDLKHTLLDYAVMLKNKELVEILLNNKSNPNLQDKYGNHTIIMCIITLNQTNNQNEIIELLEILKLLIKYGGNPILQNYENKNAYHYINNTSIKQEIIDILNNKEQTLKKIKKN